MKNVRDNFRVNEKQQDEILVLKNKIKQFKVEFDIKAKEQKEITDVAQKKQMAIENAVSLSIKLSSTKLFKLIHLVYRIKHQLIKGSIDEKKDFIRWILKRQNKNVYIGDHRYNPLYQIIDILEGGKKIRGEDRSTSSFSGKKNLLKSDLKFSFNGDYKKVDVIILSIINYDFRYQRPQHFANVFAENGHRVFYINANFSGTNYKANEDSSNLKIFNIKAPNNNIYSVIDEDIALMDTELENIIDQYGIRDCFVIVQYPNWYKNASLLRYKYGFHMITDYLDDFTGFQDTTSQYLRENCNLLLKYSDLIIATSDYLYNKAEQFNNKIEIIRNGTEFDHFNTAFTTSNIQDKKQTVGYYGAVSHWFDFDKLEYIARNLTDVEIVVIGDVTENEERLKAYSNIKLLGEKKYSELPLYLKTFDVCLIPFDTSSELIQATNPVKFYEYLSAGKKIVATEMPELFPYKDKFVYLSNSNTEFLEYVKLCLSGQDELASAAECIEFAKQHDWEAKGTQLIKLAAASYPMISIIILTYNQLEYTKKCIQSILNKTAYPNYEIIIVDNCSDDGTKDYLLGLDKEIDQVKVILNDINHGFAGGNNIGLEHANGDYMILLNNDTVVTRGWISGLLKHFNNNIDLGLLGPVTNSIGNEAMIKTKYKTLDDMDYFSYMYTTKCMGELYTDIRALAMYCIVIPRHVYNEVGKLDENYKIGMFEDDDYSMSVRKAGYEIACAEDVFVHHYGSVSFKKLESKKYKKIFESNKNYYEEKWNSNWVPHKSRDGV